MISEVQYSAYFDALISGKRIACSDVLQTLRNNDESVEEIYVHRFQRALYDVGKL